MSGVTEGDLGKFFLGADGEVWRLVSYAAEPTATWERVKDGDRRSGCVASPLAREFRPLVIVDGGKVNT